MEYLRDSKVLHRSTPRDSKQSLVFQQNFNGKRIYFAMESPFFIGDFINSEGLNALES